MKKFLTLLLALVLALGLTACGSSSVGDTNTPAGSDSQQQESTPSSPDGEGTLGKYAVKFTGYTLAKDYQGQDTVIISFDFTNNDEDATSAMVALNIDAYQDGIELESAILTDAPEGYDSESEMKNIKQGATLNCQKAFVLSNTSSPVEVEAEELFSLSSDKVVCTYAIAD